VRSWFTRHAAHRHQRGTTLIEFALVFPALCGMLFGMIDGGRFISARVTMAQASAAGARFACLSGTSSQADVDNAVAGYATTLPGIAVNWANSVCNGAACTVWPRSSNDQIYLQLQYNFTAAFFRGFSKQMTQSSRMVCE
jgi:Flp pilus assembly protein TadG